MRAWPSTFRSRLTLRWTVVFGVLLAVANATVYVAVRLYAYADLEESDLVVLIGSNLAIAHPILWERLLRLRRGARVVVIDPRRTETAAFADSHLALRPKTDLALLYGLAHVLIRATVLDNRSGRSAAENLQAS